MIRNVLVFCNETKDPSGEHTNRLLSYLREHGIRIFTFHQGLPDDVTRIDQAEGHGIELALVLGGDGTMIRCGHQLLGSGIPILGINLGTLGYLAEIELAGYEETLEKALSGEFSVEERMMLDASIGDDPTRFTCINDFVIHRDLSDGILSLRCDVNRHFLADFRADGVIISSPCGSTAYNFSAGGPILNPVSDNLILTPLCSHSILDRSVVLRGDDVLDFYLGDFTKSDHALFIADGSRSVRVEKDTWIHVEKSRYTFPLARVSDRSFYEIVQKKMRP